MKAAKRDFSRLLQREIAEVHRVSTRTIRTWTEWGLPRNEDGSYEIHATWLWRQEHWDYYEQRIVMPRNA